MDERRLELKIGSPVIAKDGNCGHIQRLVVDPHQEKIIGLIVQSDFLSKSGLLVPVEQVENATESGVQLRIDCQQVLSLPKYEEELPLFLEDQCYLVDNEELVTRSSAGINVLRAPNSSRPGIVENEILKKTQLPLAISIRAGQQVLCKDGHVGHILYLLLDPAGKIKGFVMRAGSLLPHHDLIVPVDWIQEVEGENVHLSADKPALEQVDEYVTDAELAKKVDGAIGEMKAPWITQNSEIGATVHDGIVTLRGHVPTSPDKILVEKTVKSVTGVLEIENRLISDYDLTIQVAQALGEDERTNLSQISVNTRIGIVSLSGQVENASTRCAVEEIAACVPNVRGVLNFIQAPGVFVDPADDFLPLPPIGQEVYATDILLGTVEKVVIDPHNRKVMAFVTHAYFTDPNLDLSRIGDDVSFQMLTDIFVQDRHVVFPSHLIRQMTESAVFLSISGKEAADYHDYDAAQYAPPPEDWQPPYPYSNHDILFEGFVQGLLGDLHELADHVIAIEQRVAAVQQEINEKVEASIEASRVETKSRQESFKAKVMQRQAASVQLDTLCEGFYQTVQPMKNKIENEKGNSEAKSAKQQAQDAITYAEAVIGFAIMAMDEAEIAVLEAIKAASGTGSSTESELQ